MRKVQPRMGYEGARVNWDRNIDFTRIPLVHDPVNRFEQRLPVFVWNAVALEGNHYTLDEVATLLCDGVAAVGRDVEDTKQVLAFHDGVQAMLAHVRAGKFRLGKAMSDEVHGLAARHEAIEAGHFRGEGSVHGGGAVRLADGSTVVEGDPSGDGGETLMDDYENLIVATEGMGDARERAFAYFASATRSQFYFDGNKRTARIMMAGELLSNGFEAVNVPYARAQEFNTALDELFRSDDATELFVFLSTCAPER